MNYKAVVKKQIDSIRELVGSTRWDRSLELERHE